MVYAATLVMTDAYGDWQIAMVAKVSPSMAVRPMDLANTCWANLVS